jgi:hypothetical protein
MSDLQSSFRSNIQQFIANFAEKADEMDNYLIDNFGCESSEYSKFD